MIRIIAVGKYKENYLKQADADYLKRISHYDRISVCEIEEGNASLLPQAILKQESERIIKACEGANCVILLDRCAKQTDSEGFSKILFNAYNASKSKIAFVIGGSGGVDESVKKRADISLSFSSLTFPHGLFRIMLEEQIYRSFKIINNETYHK